MQALTELAQVTAAREIRQEPQHGLGEACRWSHSRLAQAAAEVSALSFTALLRALGRLQPKTLVGPLERCSCVFIQTTFAFLGSSACISML